MNFLLVKGHTRTTQRNAHPHFDASGTIVVVHNGIIENYRSIRAFLTEQGIDPASDTDTEALAQLIGFLYHDGGNGESGNLLAAVRRALHDYAAPSACWFEPRLSRPAHRRAPRQPAPARRRSSYSAASFPQTALGLYGDGTIAWPALSGKSVIAARQSVARPLYPHSMLATHGFGAPRFWAAKRCAWSLHGSLCRDRARQQPDRRSAGDDDSRAAWLHRVFPHVPYHHLRLRRRPRARAPATRSTRQTGCIPLTHAAFISMLLLWYRRTTSPRQL